MDVKFCNLITKFRALIIKFNINEGCVICVVLRNVVVVLITCAYQRVMKKDFLGGVCLVRMRSKLGCVCIACQLITKYRSKSSVGDLDGVSSSKVDS